MAKGYWIAHVSADDETTFQSDSYKAYVSGAGPAFKEHNAKFLARGGDHVIAEGQNLGSRHVIIEFESLHMAKLCYNSESYQEARKHRTAVSNATIILLEGQDD